MSRFLLFGDYWGVGCVAIANGRPWVVVAEAKKNSDWRIFFGGPS
jgi:hypothetical protein